MFTLAQGSLLKNGRPFRIRGINLGGWLMKEGYILGGRNLPEHAIWEAVTKQAGKNSMLHLRKLVESHFITQKDFQTIRSLGFNTIRLPFNSRMLLDDKSRISEDGLQRLKSIVDRIASEKIHVILDMHAAPGSQNRDWHSDSDGRALFWEKPSCRKLFASLWKELSLTFKDHPGVIGYDILNEPNSDDSRKIFSAFETALNIIRKNGDSKILFLEGNDWAQDISFLVPFVRLFEGVAVSIHCYQPFLFSFNFIRGLRYPGIINGERWNKKKLFDYHLRFADFAQKNTACVLVGEFGVASRCPECGSEMRLVDDMLSLYDRFGWHWTYWTYKSVAGMNAPDGLFQLNQNPFWLRREFHTTSWENFPRLAKEGKKKDLQLLGETLRTESFELNKSLLRVLKKHL